jgi:hypothetical protein
MAGLARPYQACRGIRLSGDGTCSETPEHAAIDGMQLPGDVAG